MLVWFLLNALWRGRQEGLFIKSFQQNFKLYIGAETVRHLEAKFWIALIQKRLFFLPIAASAAHMNSTALVAAHAAAAASVDENNAVAAAAILLNEHNASSLWWPPTFHGV